MITYCKLRLPGIWRPEQSTGGTQTANLFRAILNSYRLQISDIQIIKYTYYGAVQYIEPVSSNLLQELDLARSRKVSWLFFALDRGGCVEGKRDQCNICKQLFDGCINNKLQTRIPALNMRQSTCPVGRSKAPTFG